MKKIKNSSNTLDSHHKKIVNTFNSKTKEFNKLNKLLSNYNNEFDKLQNKEDKELTYDEIKKKLDLKKQIQKTKKDIEYIQNNKYESDYYIKTMDMLSIYYNKEQIDDKKSGRNENNISILDFLNNKMNNKVNTLKKFVKSEKKFDKKSLFHEYLLKIDLKTNVKQKIEYVNNYTFCNNCNQEKMLIHSDALYVCPKCGECDQTIIEAEKPSYKEPIIEVCSYSYKRYNHFCEWLNQFQALETTTINDDVYNKILNEIKKEKITDLSIIDHVKMRQILKKIGINNYKHLHYIINKINGKPAPKLNKEIEEKLRLMFKQMQEPFAKVCPQDRKNFLSYAYVIRKCLELLNEKEYIEYFQLLKSREKLYEQDMIWKKMCVILKWKYIPSI
jgi:predicted RNA-binding Zn-ribbon protein involved in translation (DUF1610 family)